MAHTKQDTQTLQNTPAENVKSDVDRFSSMSIPQDNASTTEERIILAEKKGNFITRKLDKAGKYLDKQGKKLEGAITGETPATSQPQTEPEPAPTTVVATQNQTPRPQPGDKGPSTEQFQNDIRAYLSQDPSALGSYAKNEDQNNSVTLLKQFGLSKDGISDKQLGEELLRQFTPDGDYGKKTIAMAAAYDGLQGGGHVTGDSAPDSSPSDRSQQPKKFAKALGKILDSPAADVVGFFVPGVAKVQQMADRIETVKEVANSFKKLRDGNLEQINKDFFGLDKATQEALRGTPEDPDFYKLQTDIQLKQMEEVDKNPNVVYQEDFKQRTSHLAGATQPIPGGILSAAAAEDFNAMYQAAQRGGVTLIVNSSLRTYEQQEALRKENDALKEAGKPYVEVAKGTSTHELGNAVDLSTAGGTNAAYNWLKDNAANYGFHRTVPSEPWHFEHNPPAGRMIAKSRY